MKNLQIATPKVKILTSLPHTSRRRKINFETSAHNWSSFQKSNFFKPLLVEAIIDPDGTFAALHPSSRIYWSNTFLYEDDEDNGNNGDNGNDDDNGNGDSRVLNTRNFKNKKILSNIFGRDDNGNGNDNGDDNGSLRDIADFDYSAPTVFVKPIKEPFEPSIVNDLIEKYDDYDLLMPKDYTKENLAEYKGPLWTNVPIEKEIPPNDYDSIKKAIVTFMGRGRHSDSDSDSDSDSTRNYNMFNSKNDTKEIISDSRMIGVPVGLPGGPVGLPGGPVELSGGGSSGGWGSFEEIDTTVYSTSYVGQYKSRDGMYWGLASNYFLYENMPFWVIIRKAVAPPSIDKDTFFVISTGLTDDNHRFDIYLSMNNKPRIIDWAGSGDGRVPYMQKEFSEEYARIWSTQEILRVGIMVVAGRLVVTVNGDKLLFTRIDMGEGDSNGKLRECKISEGPIQIFGSNVPCAINISPMNFAQYSLLAMPVPSTTTGGGTSNFSSTRFRGMNWEGEYAPSVCHLPTPPSDARQRFGCDCKRFSGHGGSASPRGFGMNRKGEILFSRASRERFLELPTVNFYTLEMIPEEIEYGDGVIPFGGCPFFFQLRGLNISNPVEGRPQDTDITNNVISIDETVTAPDYFHVTKRATVVCYDEGGSVSNNLRNKQIGLEISWGWNNNYNKTLTGVVTSFTPSQSAGIETVTINVEDYNHILKSVPIINSPFYDGMVASRAIKDLAERAGCSSFVNKFRGERQYFLPSGLSFSKPKMRYPSTQNIFDCIMDIAKRFEVFFMFDERGQFVVEKLPGGLFSEVSGISANFSSRLDTEDTELILNDRQFDWDYSSTVNVISAMTLERDTRNPIMYVKTARGSEDKLLFRKVYLYNQAALGEMEACRQHVFEMSKRMFNPILKTRWETAGTKVDLIPLDFVNVDNKAFRVMSIKRSYNADNNDLKTSYEGEWLGGAQ